MLGRNLEDQSGGVAAAPQDDWQMLLYAPVKGRDEIGFCLFIGCRMSKLICRFVWPKQGASRPLVNRQSGETCRRKPWSDGGIFCFARIRLMKEEHHSFWVFRRIDKPRDG